jgi:hypothetical protein
VSKTISRISHRFSNGDFCSAKAAGPMTVARLKARGFGVENDLTH